MVMGYWSEMLSRVHRAALKRPHGKEKEYYLIYQFFPELSSGIGKRRLRGESDSSSRLIFLNLQFKAGEVLPGRHAGGKRGARPPSRRSIVKLSPFSIT